MKTVVIGASLFYGCDRPGVEMAPGHLRRLGLIERLVAGGHEVEDAGDICAAAACERYEGHTKMKYVAQIHDLCSRLSSKVTSVLQNGDFPLVIGGDHADGIGILSGVSRVYGPDTAVLWIDSHSDIHSFATSPSGNVHGVPLGTALGLDCGVLGDIFSDASPIKGENIFIVGLRSYEPEEAQTITRYGVNTYSTEDVRSRGVNAVMADIREKLNRSGASALHVSFDIDSLDPSIAPGTGIRVPDGLTEAEAIRIVKAAFASGLVHSMDISELNPLRDTDDMTSHLALRIVDHIPVL